MQSKLNIDYEIISSEEARSLTSGAQNPWSGQSSFVYSSKIYFVDELQSTDQVLHEFSHPLISAIRITNPGLYNKLLEDLRKTSDYEKFEQEALKEYPELDSNSHIITDEILVKTLTKSALMQNSNIPSTKSNESIVKRIILGLKKLFRFLFGNKIKVEKLSSATTMMELAKMLNHAATNKGGTFNVNTELISEKDIVQYLTDINKFSDELSNSNLDINDIIKIINNNYDLIKNHLERIKNENNLQAMQDVLAPEYGGGIYDKMSKNIAGIQTLTNANKAMEDMIEDLDFQKDAADALVRNILKIKVISKKVHEHLQKIAQAPNNADNLIQMGYYYSLLEGWKTFIEGVESDMLEAGITSDTNINALTGQILKNIKASNLLINNVREKGLVDILHKEFDVVNNRMKELWDKRYNDLKRKDAPRKVIDKEKARFDKYYITKDKFKDILKGNIGDANFMNNFLEGYMYSSDPVVASFGAYLRNNLSEVLNNAYKRSNEMMDQLKPLLDDVGYDPKNLEKFWKPYVFIDKDVRRNDEGEIESFEVYTLKNEWKDYRFSIAKKREEVDDAQKEYIDKRTKESFQDYANKLSELREHKRLFFHQDFVDDFYEADKMLDTDIGKEAILERDKILTDLNYLQDQITDEYDEFDNYTLIDNLWREYRMLFSEYGKDEKGKEKARLLKAHKELKRDFYEWKVIPNSFNNAYLNFIDRLHQNLIDEGLEEGSDEYNIKFNEDEQKWIEQNSISEISQDWYDERQKIFDRIERLTKKLPVKVKESISIEKDYRQMFDAVTPYRDQNGEPDALTMSDARIKYVKDLQEKIKSKRKAYAGLTGLTIVEYNELSNLFTKRNNDINLTTKEFKRMRELLDKKSKHGLSRLEKAQLTAAYEELSNLQISDPTIYYLDEINYILENEELTEKLQSLIGEKK